MVPCNQSLSANSYRRFAWLAALLAISVAAGCSSVLNQGAAAGAGIGGTAIAAQVTKNPTVAAGIGLGVLAAANAGVLYLERSAQRRQQDRIASVAGPLAQGQVANWDNRHIFDLDYRLAGRVAVSRLISADMMVCKEIVFSIDTVREKPRDSEFYIATICQDGERWKWASAEPATERWGSLQ